MLLKTHQMNPQVLKAGFFDGYEFSQTGKMASRVCYDYEMEYYLKSDGGILVNEKYLPFREGEINVRKPGQLVAGVAPYRCWILCIRMAGNEPLPEGYVFGTPRSAQPLYENPLLQSLEDRIRPENGPYVERLFREICTAFPKKDELNRFRANQLLQELMFELFRQSAAERNRKAVNSRISRAAEKIAKDFCEPLNIGEIVRESGLSKAYFHKSFRELTGMTPAAMVNVLRMEKAKTLLCMTDSL